MNSQPEVVIVLATYNPQFKFFTEQIQSILEQEYKNWKCLVIDDKSLGENVEKISSVLKHDSRFIFEKGEENVGACSNFSRGLVLARQKFPTAKYIALADQDDVWFSNKISTLVQYLESHGEVAFVHHDANVINEQNAILYDSVWKHEKRMVNSVHPLGLVFHNKITGAMSLMRSEILDFATPIPKQDLYFQDVWLGLQAWRMGSVVSLNTVLQSYRSHSFNVVGVKKNKPPLGLRFLVQKANLHLLRCETLSQDFLSSFSPEKGFKNYLNQDLEKPLQIFSSRNLWYKKITTGFLLISEWSFKEWLLFCGLLFLKFLSRLFI